MIDYATIHFHRAVKVGVPPLSLSKCVFLLRDFLKARGFLHGKKCEKMGKTS